MSLLIFPSGETLVITNPEICDYCRAPIDVGDSPLLAGFGVEIFCGHLCYVDSLSRFTAPPS